MNSKAKRIGSVVLAAAFSAGLGLNGAPLLSSGVAEARPGAPETAPIPRLSPRRTAELARAEEASAGSETALETVPADAADAVTERLTIARFSVTPERDEQTAAEIRPVFKTRALGDRAGREAGLPLKPRSGEVAFVLADPARGAILERRNADGRMIPASVAKAPTALYALDALGPDFRFKTRLVADGVIGGGVLKGDLYLVGGGDPVLDVNDMAALAKALKAAGVERITGRFFYDETAISPVAEILSSQPPQARYNPGVSGLMLNFNRVFVEWRRQKSGAYEFSARASAKGRSVPTDRVEVVAVPKDQAEAGFAWSVRPRIVGPGVRDGVVETWAISTRHLNAKGGRWLPLRRPGAFAAGVFQDLAHEAGVTLPSPRPGVAPKDGATLASHESGRLETIIRGMLRFSTNITAEAVGMAASRARGLERPEIERSSALMSSWADTRFGLLRAAPDVDAAPTAFLNHSGLSMESRLTARAMASILVEAARSKTSYDKFFELMPRYRMRGLPRKAQVRAKTGTVYYGRGLAGYLQCPKGKRLAFAYLHSDIPGRARFDKLYDAASGARPRGASAWLGRARAIEKKLLIRWSKAYC